MRIGIDIDGVLTNYYNYIVEEGKKYHRTKKRKVINPNTMNIKKMFGWSNYTYIRFWLEHIFSYATNNPPMDKASEIKKKLHKEENTIYIITSRFLTCSKTKKFFNYPKKVSLKMQNIVIEWLRKNDIEYDYIIFTSSKKEHIIDNKIDIMIEDNPKNILKLSKYTKVICYDNKYNQDINGNNIYRCYNWDDIDKLLGKKK